jgi:hypothetical protein
MKKNSYKIQLNEQLEMTAEVATELKLIHPKNTGIEDIKTKKLGFILGFICSETSQEGRGHAYYVTYDNRTTPIQFEDEFRVVGKIKDKNLVI